jgi:3',5'-cyclic AMP phosphodiesterase CpdA
VLRLAGVFLCALILGGASLASNGQGPQRVPEEVRFLAIGDYGVGGRAELSAGRRLHAFGARRGATLLVTLGDNDYTKRPAAFRRNWRRSFGWSGPRVAGVIGNHDFATNAGRYEFRQLGMPGPYYTRNLGTVQLFLLDSNLVDDRQTAWLEQKLASSTATWKIAVFHHPAYSCGGHGGEGRIQARWVPLFARYGVQLVLSGHDHNYQRFLARTGITYVVHGGGGAVLYRLRECPSPYPRRIRARQEHGFLYFAVTPEQLDGVAVTMRGRVTDRFMLAP